MPERLGQLCPGVWDPRACVGNSRDSNTANRPNPEDPRLVDPLYKIMKTTSYIIVAATLCITLTSCVAPITQKRNLTRGNNTPAFPEARPFQPIKDHLEGAREVLDTAREFRNLVDDFSRTLKR